MQQAIQILDEMMEERTPYKEDIPLHKTLWYEVCHWWYIALEEAKSRIQALWDGWIPVTKRLPSVWWTYLVYYWDSVYDCNFEDNRFVIYNDWYKYFQNVTHWMPLPLPPKQ